MDDPPLDEQITQVKSVGGETASEIAEAQSSNLTLHKKISALRAEQERGMRDAAYLCYLHEQRKEMERELAQLEGREYRDPDAKPDGDCPGSDAPEPPDDF